MPSSPTFSPLLHNQTVTVTLPAGWQTWNQAEKQRLLETLARERDARQRKRHASPLALAAVLDPATRTSPALRLIDDALVSLMADDSPHDALAVLVPAQEGKSTLCSRRLPQWGLAREPSAQVAAISYQAPIAIRWGRGTH